MHMYAQAQNYETICITLEYQYNQKSLQVASR